MTARVTYLAGTSYSGSTLMSMLATAHPQVVSIGEMGPAPGFEGPDFLCSCGVPLVQCPFYNAVAERMHAAGEPLDLLNMRLRLSLGDRSLDRLALGHLGSTRLDVARDRLVRHLPGIAGGFDTLARHNRAFIQASLDESGADVFFDTTKAPARIPFLSGIDGLDVRIVHLIRDPRAIVASYRRKGNPDTRTIARVWNRAHRRIRRYLEAVPPERQLAVRYEDFCREPDLGFRALCRFIGVDEMDAPRDFKGSPYHVIGNKARLPTDDRMEIRLDERWRRELPEEDQATTWSLAGTLARELGYRA